MSGAQQRVEGNGGRTWKTYKKYVRTEMISKVSNNKKQEHTIRWSITQPSLLGIEFSPSNLRAVTNNIVCKNSPNKSLQE